eukprot:GFUD01065771.1.p1 GENE.GFUD01065771.1~~GFUD01065771.1.p1  ORF type:complete len:532 (-),score=157.37 GFUD01065771.1:404-1999(-)
MRRDQNDDKKRALVMGKYKFLFQDETEDLEAGDKFQLAIVQNKLLGPVGYFDKDGKDPDVLHIYGKERVPGEGFSNPDIKIPGVLDLFTVVWSNPFGDLFVDQDIKLFEFVDIQKYSGYNDGPKSKEFCRFYSSSSSKELDGFDSSIFWSAGLLWKHFKTCGVEKWDKELRDLVDHYRNWKAWTHEVHNLPNNNKKFSDETHSGPASTSTSYSRDRRSSGNNNTSCSSFMPTSVKKPLPPPASVHYNHSVVPPAPPPVLTAPPVGQTVLVPVAAPDGSLVQVQLCTLPTPPTLSSVSGVSSLSTPSRYKYINPHLVPSLSNLNTSQPPPGYTPHTTAPSDQTTNSSTWTNQVDDFLSRPKSHKNSGDSHKSPSRSCSPVNRLKALPSIPKSGGPKKVKTGSKRKVTLVHTSNKACFKDASPIKIRKIDRAKILARMKARDEEVDSPDGKAEVNELDISPEDKLYKGEIMDWRGKFGFIGCEEINGKIFVHSKDFVEGRELADLGVEAVFQVLHQDSSVVGAKAVNVKITKT